MVSIIHRADDRGKGEHGWLSTRYSFSFADWYEPSRMGFGALRVINDDQIGPDSGFGKHSHKDMEIVTIVMKGTVTHEDSLGNKGTVPAGDVQAMSAGTGVVHAEYNDSKDEPLELFQIWIEPNERGVAPRYAQKRIGFSTANGASAEERTISTLLVGPDGSAGLPITQDAFISYATLAPGDPLTYAISTTGNGVYVFVIDGSIAIGDDILEPRDAMGIEGEMQIQLTSTTGATALLIEVPMS